MRESEYDYSMFDGRDTTSAFIDHFYVMFTNDTRAAEFYFDTFIGFIEAKEAEDLQSLQVRTQVLPSAVRSMSWERHYPYHWKDIFEETFKASFIVSVLSTLEFFLKNICRVIPNDGMKAMDKCKGNLLNKTRTFLKQSVSADLSSLDWETMDRLWRIRNVIAHNLGLCLQDTDERTLRNFAQYNDGISLDNGWLRLDVAFCRRALHTVETFGTALGDLIRDDLKHRR